MKWLIAFLLFMGACVTPKFDRVLPGKKENFYLLPNGWRLTPAGYSVTIGEMPLNLLVTPDEKWAFSLNSGVAKHTLSIIDLKRRKEVERVELENVWRGMAYDKLRQRLYLSGGNGDKIYCFTFHKGKVTPLDAIPLPADTTVRWQSLAGLALSATGDTLYGVTKGNQRLYMISTSKRRVLRWRALPAKAYEILCIPNNQLLVSLWGGEAVWQLSADSLKLRRSIPVGPHPNEMAYDAQKQILYVAAANDNYVAVVDLNKGKVLELLRTTLKEKVPPGSTPNSLALTDDNRLLVANADNNYLALFDVEQPGKAKGLGFIPTGWYPTVVRYLSGARTILVVNAKGSSGSRANLNGPIPGKRSGRKSPGYIGQLFKGSLSWIKFPSEQQLAKYSAQVYANTPYTREDQQKTVLPDSCIVPKRFGQPTPSPTPYIFYVIRENRTYDQVLGDVPIGNGDIDLCLFPQWITPNAHALVKQFVLFDNFYADAEVSADGHNWSTAAYATDYVEKLWPVMYGKRGGSYDFEGGVEISRPKSGYIWDQVIDKGLRLRIYGEFVPGKPAADGRYYPRDHYLRPYVCPRYPGFNMKIKDTLRVAIWREDFDSLLALNQVPHLSVIRLPNDHTAGTRPQYPTISASIADNDRALGMLIEHISHSPIWQRSVIFVVEDDAQNGSDHVDAHRTVLLLASPFIKPGFVDHTMYSTSSVLKTIELLLGLEPMSQYDLSARAIRLPFSNRVVNRPFKALPAAVDLDELNTGQEYGANRCLEFNLEQEDAIPDVEFNEIVWKAVKGVDSEMPPPIRSAFVNPLEID